MGNESQNIDFEEEQDIEKIKLNYLNHKENYTYLDEKYI